MQMLHHARWPAAKPGVHRHGIICSFNSRHTPLHNAWTRTIAATPRWIRATPWSPEVEYARAPTGVLQKFKTAHRIDC